MRTEDKEIPNKSWTLDNNSRTLISVTGLARPTKHTCVSWPPSPDTQTHRRGCASAWVPTQVRSVKRGARNGARHATLSAGGCNSSPSTQSSLRLLRREGLQIGRQGNPPREEMLDGWRRKRIGRCASIVNTGSGHGWQRPKGSSMRRVHTRILLRAANRRGMSSTSDGRMAGEKSPRGAGKEP